MMLVKVPTAKLPLDAIKLTGRANQNAKVFCGPSESPRRKIYVKENPKQAKKIAGETRITVLKNDAKTNTAFMAISVGIFSSIGALGAIGGPVGAAAGVGAGAGVGLIVGGLIINSFVNKKIRVSISLSNHYAEWRNEAIVNRVYPIFKNFIDADKEFEDFMCPISQDICSVPMLAPDGKTYDRDHIVSYIRSKVNSNDDHIDSPIRKGTFCVNDLVLNNQYCHDIVLKTRQVYQRCILHGDAQVKIYGLQAVIKNTQDIMGQLYKSVYKQTYDQMESMELNGQITNRERKKIAKKTAAQWDFESIGK